MTVNRAGGAAHTFQLVVTASGNRVSVRAVDGASNLPHFCPDRHINLDGSFCLGWDEDDPSRIVDQDSARHWWSAVYQFLIRQVNANSRGVFPGAEHGRAHGGAARHQANAEKAAALLGPAFAQSARTGKFSVMKDKRPGRERLELRLDEERIARVSTQTEVIVGGHTMCPCGAIPARKVETCGTHAQALATFILESHACQVADRKCLSDAAALGAVCCGTLHNCGLRNAINRKQAKAPIKGKPHARRSKYWRPPAKSKRPH